MARRVQVHLASAPVDFSPLDAFGVALQSDGEMAWLDSAIGHAKRGRHCFLALELEEAVCTEGDELVLRDANGSHVDVKTARWKAVDEVFAAESQGVSGLGWLGYVAYEAAPLFDPAFPSYQHDLPFPVLRFDRVRAAVVRDETGSRLVASGQSPEEARRRLDKWWTRFQESAGVPSTTPLSPLEAPDGALHQRNVAELREHIAGGRVYQTCYTFPLRFERPETLAPAYVALRRASPGDYGAYLRFNELEVASSSPERFVSIKGHQIECRPMKGTRPRLGNVLEDASIAAELAASEKDRAENVMIVDLMRNDIGRVCEVGSVSVPSLFDVETYATVHQMTSTVTGTLREGVGPFQVLEAAFPPGSMTGAPKVAACQLLRNLEVAPRGLYSGTIGWLGYDGHAEFSVVIRTLQAWQDLAQWNVGGGIVWDSTPEGEWEEALQKAEALRKVGLLAEAERTVSEDETTPT